MLQKGCKPSFAIPPEKVTACPSAIPTSKARLATAIARAETESGKSIAHYDLRFLKPLDEGLLHEVGRKFRHIVTIEDGVIQGGMGSAVLEFMADHEYTPTSGVTAMNKSASFTPTSFKPEIEEGEAVTVSKSKFRNWA